MFEWQMLSTSSSELPELSVVSMTRRRQKAISSCCLRESMLFNRTFDQLTDFNKSMRSNFFFITYNAFLKRRSSLRVSLVFFRQNRIHWPNGSTAVKRVDQLTVKRFIWQMASIISAICFFVTGSLPSRHGSTFKKDYFRDAFEMIFCYFLIQLSFLAILLLYFSLQSGLCSSARTLRSMKRFLIISERYRQLAAL